MLRDLNEILRSLVRLLGRPRKFKFFLGNRDINFSNDTVKIFFFPILVGSVKIFFFLKLVGFQKNISAGSVSVFCW